MSESTDLLMNTKISSSEAPPTYAPTDGAWVNRKMLRSLIGHSNCYCMDCKEMAHKHYSLPRPGDIDRVEKQKDRITELTAEVASLEKTYELNRAVIDRYRTALEEIAKTTDYIGFAPRAEIAKDALK